MTKVVRIVNADTGSAEVVVQLWRYGAPDKKIHEETLSYPSAMAELAVSQNCYITIKETFP